MDAIPYIKKPDELISGIPDGIDGMVSIHNMTVNTDGILDYLREFKQNVTSGKDVFTVGEANGVGPDDLKYWIGDDGVFDMIFEFSHVNLEFKGVEVWYKPYNWTLKDLKRAIGASQAATKDNGWYPIYFENHDKPRSVNHFWSADADPVLAAKAMAAILLTLRGTPFIYQGEELGMTNVRWDSIEDYNDINTISQYHEALGNGLSHDEAMECVSRFSRDNARTPMQWDGSDNAGFTAGTPWLPVNDNYISINAKQEYTDPDSVWSWYKDLAGLRCEHDAFTGGRFIEVCEDSDSIYAFIRESSTGKFMTVVNFTSTEQSYDAMGGEIILDSYPEDPAFIGRLRPYEAVVIKI